MSRPLLLGHRGLRLPGGPPENSPAAFEAALAAGCDGFEFDVRLSSDLVPVIVHDPTYGGLEVARRRAGDLGVPTLRDVLAQFSGRAFLDIELKTAGMEKQVLELLSVHRLNNALMVSSFLPDVIRELHTRQAGLPLAFIFDEAEQRDLWRDLPVAYVVPHCSLVTSQFIASVHGLGRKLMTWTVNRPDDMLRLAEWGADGLISDNPQLLAATLRA